MSSVLGGMDYVDQRYEQGVAKRKEGGLSKLMGEYAAGGQPDYAGIAANGGNPLAVRQDANEQKQARVRELGQYAGYLASLPPESRPQAYAALAPKLSPIGQELGLGPLPSAWDESHLPELHALAQLGGGRGKADLMNLSPGGVAFDPTTGREVYRNTNFAPVRPTWDSDRGGWAVPPSQGGPSPHPSAPPQGSGMDARYAETAQFMERNGVPAEKVAEWLSTQPGMVPANEGGSGSGGVAGGGGFVQIAPPKVDERLELARQANERAREASERAAEAARNSARGTAPAGYRFNAQNALEKIPGGPQDAGKPLPAPVVTKLTKQAETYDNTADLLSRFDDSYSGNVVGGGLENLAGRLGGERIGIASRGQADWWQAYDRQKNEVRNALFGAALTPSEQAAFEAADITPNMDPSRVRENLETQKSIISKALERQSKVWKAQGYNTEAIDAAVMPSAPKAPTDAGLSPEEQAELAQLRARFNRK